MPVARERHACENEVLCLEDERRMDEWVWAWTWWSLWTYRKPDSEAGCADGGRMRERFEIRMLAQAVSECACRVICKKKGCRMNGRMV